MGKKPAYYGVRSALRHRVIEKEKEQTGIKVTDGTDNEDARLAKSEWYTLDGRLLNAQPTKRGIYIVNRTKHIIW